MKSFLARLILNAPTIFGALFLGSLLVFVIGGNLLMLFTDPMQLAAPYGALVLCGVVYFLVVTFWRVTGPLRRKAVSWAKGVEGVPDTKTESP